MPLVPAAGYQYNPYPETRAPLTPGADYLNINPNPEQFGATVGGAERQLGSTFGQAANEFSEAAIQRQSLYNQIVADKAQTDYMQRSHRLLFGDPQSGDPGLFGLHGEDAMQRAKTIGPELDDLARSISDGLPNARAKLEFNEYTRRLRVWTDRDVLTHYEKEMDKYGQETQEVRNQAAIDQAGLYYNDPDRLAQALAIADQSAVRKAENIFGANASDEIKQNYINNSRDKFAHAVVNGYLSHNDPAGAEKFIKDHPGLVTNPTVMEQINQAVHNKSIDQRVKNFVYGGKPTTSDAEALQKDPAGFIKGKESGGNYNIGYGGVDLSNAPLDDSGFPIWDGRPGPQGISHAAGAYEFQPATWRKYAVPLGIHDFSPASQDRVFAAAWKAEGPTPWMSNPKVAGALTGFNFSEAIRQASNEFPDPQDFSKAVTAIDGLQRAHVLEAQEAKRKADEQSEQLANGYASKIIKGQIPDGMLDDIAADVAAGKMKWETGRALENMALAKHGAKDYGEGFWPTYNRLFLPDGDPNKIADPDQIYRMAGPDGNLSLPGAEKLVQLINSKKTPEGEAFAASEKEFFTGLHHEMVLDSTDTEGETAFKKAQILAWKNIQAGLKATPPKTTEQLFDPDSPDYVGKGLPKRDKTKLLQDLLKDGPPTTSPPQTLPKITNQKAYDDLKSKDHFIGPDGIERVKP